jgi:general secretion pathway protein K
MKARGFVLVATLWILAGIAIAATYFAQRIARSIELAQVYDAHVKSRIACSDSKAELAYLFSTRPLSMYGLGGVDTHFKLDNRPYKMEGDCIARLQDNRGLYLINGPDRDTLGVMLRQKLVPDAAHDQLYDTLMDFIDPNPNIHRLNGVALRAYQDTGLPPPSGRPLVTPDELRNVFGWAGQSVLWSGDEPFTDWITTGRTIGINPNTAPAQVLATLPGISEAGVNLILQYRSVEPILSETQLANLVGIDPQKLILKIFTFPADAIRISLGSIGQATSIRYNITLTPTAPEAPWRVDYYYPVPQLISNKKNDELPSNPFDLTIAPPVTAPNIPIF